ncbi:MAG: hypothetical protein D6717_13585 [Gammaproteobacteria bacterium]|nr:MAG: hypothetical protein D6717_13585 [Gammaproteobacteria bacterium]
MRFRILLVLPLLLLAACQDDEPTAGQSAGRQAILAPEPPGRALREARDVRVERTPRQLRLEPAADGWQRADIRPRVSIEAERDDQGRIRLQEHSTPAP